MEFIKQNFTLLLTAFITFINLLTFIITIFKGTKSYNSFLVSALEKLPVFILEAEEMGFNSGESKKMYVLRQCVSYLISLTGLKEEKIVSLFSSTISLAIENILACPQKKGA